MEPTSKPTAERFGEAMDRLYRSSVFGAIAYYLLWWLAFTVSVFVLAVVWLLSRPILLARELYRAWWFRGFGDPERRKKRGRHRRPRQ